MDQRVPDRTDPESYNRGRSGDDENEPFGVRSVCEYELRVASTIDKMAWGMRNGVAGKIAVTCGNIANFKGSVIVNAANQRCLGGGGVDAAITRAGGEGLRKAREALPSSSAGVRCPTGEAVRTTSYLILSK